MVHVGLIALLGPLLRRLLVLISHIALTLVNAAAAIWLRERRRVGSSLAVLLTNAGEAERKAGVGVVIWMVTHFFCVDC